MIDIHSHLLAGIDDGAQTISESVALCRYAVNNGITHSVFTPHIHPGRYENTRCTIEPVFNRLQAALQEAAVPLKISYAAEVRISVEMMAMIEQDQIPFLGYYQDNKLLLLEMPHSHVMPGSQKLIDWLLKRNIRPVIAHPERNKELLMDYSKVLPFVQQGCLLQLTAASVAGNFGSRCQDFARYLVEHNLVSYVATDAHNLQHRPPDLKQCMTPLRHWAGQERAEQLVKTNAWKIVRSRFDN